MHILELQLATASLAAQSGFYHSLLGLPLVAQSEQSLIVQIGASRLRFATAPRPLAGVYHVAFTIPRNQFDAARHWLEARVPLLSDAAGTRSFTLPSWDAQMVYFRDPAGNILELIARQELANDVDEPFGPASLRAISEIGVAAYDVPAQAAGLVARSGEGIYRGSASPSFAAVGDAHGLIIVVQRGRVWHPNTGQPAVTLPITLHIAGPTAPLTLRFAEPAADEPGRQVV